ncbi:GDSL family lipase [Rhodovarius crocodyli]|uniref:GDSL family lipase n=1 Tax=Rhodovarius crocodyli TaxID=1979269 RepID=A0A437MGF6_9PROT|nr:GDSL-type esterase/lipase family protein [Rhodovarius crocodyli]RVT96733.1 GDSL family lipase [Rhodovarius crocodyli]
MRVCFFGDSMVNGTGDDECLGWVGRACAEARRGGTDLTCYNLGIRRDTSADVRARWRREAEARLPAAHDGRLVFSFGANDCCANDAGGGVRVDHAAALAHAEAILLAAAAWRPVLMVGPFPIHEPATDARIAALGQGFAQLCARLGVPYLSVFETAAGSAAWAREVAAGDGAHPNAQGYAEVAAVFSRWPAWRAWLGAASAP